ncbi:MAG TPA: hypothetical protein VIX17_11335 [Pyrinomonadaceae bacterium]|jgi:hypothetical protein
MNSRPTTSASAKSAEHKATSYANSDSSPAAPSRDDQEAARQVVRDVDAHFDRNERLRLGKWIDPEERERLIADHIATALAASRAEMIEKIKVKRDEYRMRLNDFEGVTSQDYRQGQQDAADELLTEIEGTHGKER